jgi:hypothetical protein
MTTDVSLLLERNLAERSEKKQKTGGVIARSVTQKEARTRI